MQSDKTEAIVLRAESCLRPTHVINIGQYYGGQALGGITIQVQVPLPEGSCFEKFPPMDIYVVPEKSKEQHGKPGIENACELVKCLNVGKQEVCGVKLKSVFVKIKFQDDGC